jgi:hypothetical protein
VVEHRLAKARVASSNLVSRSIPPSGARRVGYGGMERQALKEAALPRRGTQVVRERSAKPLCVGSIPTRASNLFNNLDSISSGVEERCWGNCGSSSFRMA